MKNKTLIPILILIFTLIAFSGFSQTARITVSNGTYFNVSGNVIVNIDNLDFVNNSAESMLGGTFIFSGNQEIAGTQESEFTNLEVTNDALLTLGNNILIVSDLALTQGIINVQGNNLTLYESTTITGTPSSSNMIVVDGTGYLIKRINAIGTYLFPIGDNTSVADYSPVELTFNSATFDNASVSINLSDSKHPNNTSSTDYLTRFWTINSSGISAFNCDVDFTYINDNTDIEGSEANIFGALWNGANWIKLNQASTSHFTGNVDVFGIFSGLEESATSIYFLDDDQFLVNYSNGIIRLFSPKNIQLTHAELYNSIGQLVSMHDLNDQTYNEIQYSGSPGYYLLKINTDKSSLVKKIIIK